MQHQSPYFSMQEADEWLIYYSRTMPSASLFFKEATEFETPPINFNIYIRGKGSSYRIEGKYTCGDEHQFELKQESVDLTLKATLGPEWEKTGRFGTEKVFTGKILLEGAVEVAECRVSDGDFNKDVPVIQIKETVNQWELTAVRAEPGVVTCPLLVHGIKGSEMVLEEYGQLKSAQRRLLPKEKARGNFVGSLRSRPLSIDPFNGHILGTSLLIAMAQELAIPDFLTDR